MTNTKLYISRMDLSFRYPKIDTLIVTEENEQSRVYLYDNRSNIAYIPHKSFTWGMLIFAPMHQELKLSIPDYLEIDVESLNDKGINKHIKSVVVRTECREYEYSRDEFCQYFSRKLVYLKDDAPNRKYRLKPITEVVFDDPMSPSVAREEIYFFGRTDEYSFASWGGHDIISRKLGDQIREEAKKNNAKLVTVGQEIVQIAGDIIKGTYVNSI